MRRRLALIVTAAVAAYPVASRGAVLITSQEAQLQPAGGSAAGGTAGGGFGTDRGTPTRGPDLTVQSPQGAVASPFALRVVFTPHNGARIDPDSVTVTLLTKPEVDLTKRVRPFISARGVEFGQAEAPRGQYKIKIELTDDAGHIGATTVNLQVQ